MLFCQRPAIGALKTFAGALRRELVQPRVGLGTPAALTTKPMLGGLGRWLFTTNHKEIGILYIIFGTFAGLFGSVLS